ncbi:hypothetical protein VPHK406_0044 [Vibrio phage K406]
METVRTFTKVVQKQVVIEEEAIEQSYTFPLYLKSESGDQRSYIRLTIDENWEGYTGSDKFNVTVIETEYNDTVIEDVSFDSCFSYELLEYIEDYLYSSTEQEFQQVVAQVKEKL